MNRRLSLFVLMLFATATLVYGHNSPNAYEIVPNKGQWHQNVSYRIDIPGGKVFLEKKGITYLLYEADKLSRYHVGDYDPGEKGLVLQAHAIKVEYLDATGARAFETAGPFEHYYNYYIGNKPEQWAPKTYPVREVTYKGLYPGIDQRWYTHGGRLKYDLIVEPGSDPGKIRFEVKGAENLRIEDKKLKIKTKLGEIAEERPVAYQVLQGEKVPVECGFRINGDTVSFELGSYDDHKPLVIDPTLNFSTYSGSTSDNFGYTATFDSEGHLYSGSTVFGASGNYPVTAGAFQINFQGGVGTLGSGGVDIAITKYDTTGTSLIYSTLIGGMRDELPHSLFVNTRDELYLFGTTGSADFPVTPLAYDTTFASNPNNPVTLAGLGISYPFSSDLIVTRFNKDGTALIASTYIGGSQQDGLNTAAALKYNYADEVRGEIEIDYQDNVYIATCTASPDFPVTSGTFQPQAGTGQDGVVLKMTSDLSSVIWSSYYGGNASDALYSLAIADNDDVYVTGGTNSTDIPSFSHPFFNAYSGGRSDAYIGRISSDGTTLLESSYVGTTEYDQSYFVELDSRDNAYLLGQTESAGLSFIVNLNQTTAPYINYNSGQFIIKFNSELDSIHWSTKFGIDDTNQAGINPNLSPTAFLVDLCHSIYLSGWGGETNSSLDSNNAGSIAGMDITPGTAFQTTTDSNDFYIMVLSDDATSITYGSYFGGPIASEHVDGGTSRFDRKGKIYQSVCAGCRGSSDFPIHPANAWSSTNNSNNCNNAVFKMDFLLPLVVADFTVPEKRCAPYDLQVVNNSKLQSATSFYWDLGDGTSSNDSVPSKTYTDAGTYEVRLALSDTSTCNLSDTITRVIEIQEDTSYQLTRETICKGDTVNIGIVEQNQHTYQWYPDSTVLNATKALTSAFADTTTEYLLVDDDGTCKDSIYQVVVPSKPEAVAPGDTLVCNPGTNFQLAGNSGGSGTYFIWSSNRLFSDTLNTITDSAVTLNPGASINTYHFKVVDSIGCAESDSVTISIGNLSLKTTGDTAICTQDTVTLSAFSTNPQDTLTFQWSADSTLLTKLDSARVRAYPKDITTYFVRSDNKDGCISRDTITVAIDSTQVKPPADTLLCDLDLAFKLAGSSNGDGVQFIWSNDSLFSDTLNAVTDSVATLSPAFGHHLYYIKVIDSLGCEATANVSIEQRGFKLASSPDTVICHDDTAVLGSQPINISDTLNYNWLPTSNILTASDSSQIAVAPLDDESFRVTAHNNYGCITLDTVSVTVSNLQLQQVNFSIPDSIYQGQEIEVSASPDGSFNYLWQPGSVFRDSTAAQTSAQPAETIQIELTVSDPGNEACRYSKRQRVVVYEVLCKEPNVFIPTAFTPNNDGLNDAIKVYGKHVQSVNMEIYNRWGEAVFNITDDQPTWDGQVDENQAPEGVYYYQADIECIDGQQLYKKGDFTLMR